MNHHPQSPKQKQVIAAVSNNQSGEDEIREVLVTAKNFADEAGISEEMIEIDISDEFLKSVEDCRPQA